MRKTAYDVNKPETPARDLGALDTLKVRSLAGPMVTLPESLTQDATDAFVVMRRGVIAAERYAPHYDPARPHLIFSITKSVTGLIAEILAEQGKLATALSGPKGIKPTCSRAAAIAPTSTRMGQGFWPVSAFTAMVVDRPR